MLSPDPSFLWHRRPGRTQLSLGLVFLGHSCCSEKTRPLYLHLLIGGVDTGSVGFGNAAPVSFDDDVNAFRAQPRGPPDFLCLICTWPFPEPSASASPFPGLDVSIHILLKGLADAWLLRARVGPVLKSSFPLQRKIPVE